MKILDIPCAAWPRPPSIGWRRRRLRRQLIRRRRPTTSRSVERRRRRSVPDRRSFFDRSTRLESLAFVLQFLLCLLEFRDVDAVTDVAQKRVGCVEARRALQQDPAERPVMATQAAELAEECAFGVRVGEGLGAGRHVFRVQVLRPAAA